MKKVLVPFADGFEEIETVAIIDILRRAGMDVMAAGTHQGPLKGSRRIKLVPDLTLDDIGNQDFDLLVIPGGQPGVDNLRKDERLLEIIRKMNGRRKWIGAICAGPLVLKDAGITEGLKMTSHPSVEKEFSEAKYTQSRVEVAGHIVTSRGPGTAIEFAIKLVELLEDKAKAKRLADLMLARIS